MSRISIAHNRRCCGSRGWRYRRPPRLVSAGARGWLVSAGARGWRLPRPRARARRRRSCAAAMAETSIRVRTGTRASTRLSSLTPPGGSRTCGRLTPLRVESSGGRSLCRKGRCWRGFRPLFPIVLITSGALRGCFHHARGLSCGSGERRQRPLEMVSSGLEQFLAFFGCTS